MGARWSGDAAAPSDASGMGSDDTKYKEPLTQGGNGTNYEKFAFTPTMTVTFPERQSLTQRADAKRGRYSDKVFKLERSLIPLLPNPN